MYASLKRKREKEKKKAGPAKVGQYRKGGRLAYTGPAGPGALVGEYPGYYRTLSLLTTQIPRTFGGKPLKWWDSPWAPIPYTIPVGLGTNIVFSPLPGIQEGTTFETRVGPRISVKQVDWRLESVVQAPGAAMDVHNMHARFTLLLDKQCNGALAAASDIFRTDQQAILSFRNQENIRRFKVLEDKVFCTSNWANSATGDQRAPTVMGGSIIGP